MIMNVDKLFKEFSWKDEQSNRRVSVAGRGYDDRILKRAVLRHVCRPVGIIL